MNLIQIPDSYKYIGVFLTMRCNLKCSFCLNHLSNRREPNKKKFNELSGKEWIRSLNRIVSRPEVPVTFSGGEPYLHPDFIEIIKGLKPDLNIDILTNLHWGKKGIDRFIEEIDPARINRNLPYPAIRVSYHPEQMGDGEDLVINAKRLQNAGFSIGIYSVQYPSPSQLESITQMQFLCRSEGIDFRVKDFTGKYEGVDDFGRPFSITYGNYSKYPGSVFQPTTQSCLCRTSELLIGPNGDVYKCHRDLYNGEFPIGNIKNPAFKVNYKFRECGKYGNCHPCDVKVKTNHKQEVGHTSVEIKRL